MISEYLSRIITSGISVLSKAADELSRGNFGARANISTDDEVGRLAQTFNNMAAQIAELYANLDKKVNDKTALITFQLKETENAKKAIMNLLEDIEDDKKRVEEIVKIRTTELREEKTRFLASVNSLQIGFAIVDNEGAIIINNPALRAVLGPTEGTSAIEIKNLDAISKKLGGKDDLKKHLERCAREKCVIEIKEIFIDDKYIRIFLTPVFENESDNSLGGVLLVEDITEAKVMERSREEFFAIASHELRTPLTAIRGNTEMIMDNYSEKIKDPDVKEMLTDINEASVRLIDIVNDFLEVSRLEQGRSDLKPEVFDLNEAIETVAGDMQGVIAKKGLTMITKPYHEKPVKVFANKNKVEQVLVNLVGNALKFTQKGSITISVVKLNGFYKVSVSDTGIGVSEQNQSLLFRKFQQAGEQMLARDITQGTGLGLYISKLLISNMGGTIGLEKSELGKGSVFSFTVPGAS